MFGKALFFLIYCAVGLAPCLMQAQQATNDPTIEQTIAFLNDLREKVQPPPNLYYRANPFVLVVDGDGKRCTLIKEPLPLMRSTYHLDTADANSVVVDSGEVRIGQIQGETSFLEGSMTRLPKFSPPTTSHETVSIYGRVVGFEGSTILAVVWTREKLSGPAAMSLRLERGQIDKQFRDQTKGLIVGGFFTVDYFYKENGRPSFVSARPASSGEVFAHAGGEWGVEFGRTQSLTVGDGLNKDQATRAAKAIIHAIVLCHKDDKPALF